VETLGRNSRAKFAPVIGAAIAVIITGAVCGLPDRQESDVAQGGEPAQ
jgi:hypothetical protein